MVTCDEKPAWPSSTPGDPMRNCLRAFAFEVKLLVEEKGDERERGKRRWERELQNQQDDHKWALRQQQQRIAELQMELDGMHNRSWTDTRRVVEAEFAVREMRVERDEARGAEKATRRTMIRMYRAAMYPASGDDSE